MEKNHSDGQSSEGHSSSKSSDHGKGPLLEEHNGESSALHLEGATSSALVDRATKKRKVNRNIIPLSSKQVEHVNLADSQAVIPSVPLQAVQKLAISEIGQTCERFAIEGKTLNVYGTYDSPRDYKKFLKTDLTDDIGFNTVTLIFGHNYYKKYLDKVYQGACFRIEGANVCARNPNDGGSINFSLEIDATTMITPIPPFQTELFFVPKLTIRSFLSKVLVNPSLKTTIAFIIVQVDNIQKIEGGVFEKLTIADGPKPLDRATLTFVNKKKSLYYQMVDDFHRGNIVPLLARNIGAWKVKSNTLSILDITLIAPVHSDKKKKSLEVAFHSQIKSLGYGKEVCGQLHILNFNGTLMVQKCSSCKSQNLNLLVEGAFCYSCGSGVPTIEEIKLVGEIQQVQQSIEVTLSGDVVDKVLRFDKPVLKMCKDDLGLLCISLSEVEIDGVFVLDPHGRVIAYQPQP